MIKLVESIEEANAITHAGSFHADDIFSTIFLSKMKDIYLYRTNNLEENIQGKIIYDIGLGEFDHHGVDAKIRENGIKYSSFGLLFEKFGKDYLKTKQVKDLNTCYEMFLQEFILQVDAIDNGIFPKKETTYNLLSLPQLIELFNPTWKEEKTSNEAFESALFVGEKIFNRIETRILDKMKAKDIIEQKIKQSQNHILLLEQYMPYMDFVLNSKEESGKSLYYCIYPSNRGGYNIQAILKSKETHENRLNFPSVWGGKTKEELYELTLVETFRFCHIGLFLCACDTLEDAKKIAYLAIEQKKN